jgi:probable phosphoglycerate mutase
VALFAHGHLLRSLAGTWLGLGVAGGALLVLGTGTTSVLGQEREQHTLLRWNAPVGNPA